MTNLQKLSLNTLPGYSRILGFNDLFENLSWPETPTMSNYPPCNIVQEDDDHLLIEFAVAGFAKEQLEVEISEKDYSQNILRVSGTHKDFSAVSPREEGSHDVEENYTDLEHGAGSVCDNAPKGRTYIHRGLGKRNFTLKFIINKNFKIMETSLENGMLTLKFEREIPESAKPKRIEIGSPQKSKK